MPCKTRGSTRSKPTWPWAIKADIRDYGIGIQLLKDLGLTKIRLLTNNPKKIHAFSGFDLEVVDQVPIVPPVNEHNARYIATKREKLGHWSPEDRISRARSAQPRLQTPWMMTVFVSVISSMAYLGPSRPRPLSFSPP